MVTYNDIEKMSKIDIKEAKKSDLVDIGDVFIDIELPASERINSFIRQVKNPYCFIDHGIIVKISFSGKKKLEDCLKQCVFS